MIASESRTIDFREVFRMLVRRRNLLLLPSAAALLIGLAAAFLLRPVYLSNVTLLLERPQALSGGTAGGANPEHQAEIMREQVQSSLFLNSVLTATGIKNEPKTREWALKASERYSGRPEQKIEAFLIDHLRASITIRRGRVNSFTIMVADHLPDRARRFAEAVANQFVVSSRAAQLEAVRATQEFSIEQQQVFKRKLEESEQRLEAFRSNPTNASGSTTEGDLQRARSLLERADLEIEDRRQRVQALKDQFGNRVRENDPALLSSPRTVALSGQLNGLERQLASSTLNDVEGDNGQTVRQAIARKISELEAEFQQNAAVALPALSPDGRNLLARYRLAQADLLAKQARRTYLAGQLGGYRQRAVTTPNRDVELQRLEQEVENNRSFYNSFLQQSVAAQIQEAFENAKVSGRFVILEPATTPRSPAKPNRPALILLSLVIGGMVGVGSVLLVERHDQSVKNAEEVENLLGLPVLGAVPRVDELDRSRRRRSAVAAGPGIPAPRDPGLLHRLKVESPLGLEFRRIYLKLAKTRGRSLPRTLLITSSTRGEGKSTISACLGITFAREMREKLLLVDFDLRSPALHRLLGLPRSSWGLAQMLNQQNFDERFVRSTVLPHLDFLPAGKSERPASELLDTGAVEWFMKEALGRYPMILIDSAPSLAVPDPLILGRAVEGVLYVIKAGATVFKAAEYGIRVQREARDNVLGVLMNDAGEILPHYYGYHDAYGYTSEVAGGES